MAEQKLVRATVMICPQCGDHQSIARKELKDYCETCKIVIKNPHFGYFLVDTSKLINSMHEFLNDGEYYNHTRDAIKSWISSLEGSELC